MKNFIYGSLFSYLILKLRVLCVKWSFN